MSGTDWLLKADLAMIQQRTPELVAKVEAIIKGIDVDNPQTIIQAGGEYRDALAKVGLDAGAAISQITDADTLKNISEFRRMVEASLEPIRQKKTRKEKALALASDAGGALFGMAKRAMSAVGVKVGSGIPTSQELEARMAELRADASELDGFVRTTVGNALALDAAVTVSDKKTRVVADEVVKLRKAHKEAALGLLLTLVAIREVDKRVVTEITTLTEGRSALDQDDIPAELQKQARIREWLQRAETDLMTSIASKGLQKGILDSLEVVNTDVMADLANVRSTALPAITEMLSTLRMQQAVAQGAAINAAAHGIARDTVGMTARGLAKTMEITDKAAQARHASIEAIPSAITAAITAVDKFTAQRALASTKEAEQQRRLATGLAGLTELAHKTSLLRTQSGATVLLGGPTRDGGTDQALLPKPPAADTPKT